MLFVLFDCQLRPHKYKDNCSQTSISGPTPESCSICWRFLPVFKACGLKLLFFLAVTLRPAIFLTLKITPSLNYSKFLKQLYTLILYKTILYSNFKIIQFLNEKLSVTKLAPFELCGMKPWKIFFLQKIFFWLGWGHKHQFRTSYNYFTKIWRRVTYR